MSIEKDSVHVKTTVDQPQVTQVEDRLILSFPNADVPIVWKTDLKAMKKTGFILQKKDSGYAIVEKTADKEETVALFSLEAEAKKSLAMITQALLSAQETKDSKRKKKKGSFFMEAVKTIIIFLAFFVVLFVLFGSFFIDTKDQSTVLPSASQVTFSDAPKIDRANTPVGVPLLADQVLEKKENQ